MTWTLELGKLPTISLNHRGHWSKRAKASKEWREKVAWLAKAERIPLLDRPTVELTYVAPDRRRRDADNLVPCLKAAVDGLRDAGVLVDDSSEDVLLRMPRIVHEADRGGWWLLTVEGEAA